MSDHSLNGDCPIPFLQESLFPSSGGFTAGRFCQDYNGTVCCLPCPMSVWRYGPDVDQMTIIASWISVAVLCLCAFLLISYAVLPTKWSHRHYLNVTFTIGICFMEIAFIIPLGAKPSKCHNEITPNDMYSDLSCAWTGSLLLFGGWIVIVWSLIRTVAFHLQVCWEMVLGRKFMWGAVTCGLGIPIAGQTIMLIYTGVSYRFGETCHININKSKSDYWIPLLALSAAALVLQLTTLIYCVYIYVRSIFGYATATRNTAPPSCSGDMRSTTARQAYRRVRRVLQLQWRAVTLVLIIIGNVVYFAVVFIDLNDSFTQTPANIEKAQLWIMCLGATQGDIAGCQEYAKDIGPDGSTLLGVLILLSLVGVWNFILSVRPSVFVGWADFIKSKAMHQRDYVSASAHFSYIRNYEMLECAVKAPEPVITRSAMALNGTRINDTKGLDDRGYLKYEQ